MAYKNVNTRKTWRVMSADCDDLKGDNQDNLDLIEDYLRRNGFNAVSAKKGAGSVKAGISFLQDMKIICHESCVNVAAELENYVYLKDKKTGQYIEDSYDHDFSHTMDALRYSYSDLYSAARLTSAKLMLGI